jgi:hypothetical protein
VKKRFTQITLAAILLILPVQSVSSQIVLEPKIKGTIRFHRSCYSFKYYSSWTTRCRMSGFYESPALWARKHKASWTEFRYGWYYYTSYQNGRPVFEFDISRSSGFPPAWMTPFNWNANLKGMCVLNNSLDAVLSMYKQFPEMSDGRLDERDYDSGQTFITYLYADEQPDDIPLSPIDVTAAIRENLFGNPANDYVGFLLLTDNFGSVELSDPYLEIVQIPQETPTPKPDPTPTPNNDPTPTPNNDPTPPPAPDFKLKMKLNQTVFRPGDPFSLVVTIGKPDSQSYFDQPLCVILDLYGDYFFYPLWDRFFDYALVDLTIFIESFRILQFDWPDVTGHADGIVFHAAVLGSDMMSVAGNVDSVEFGWTDK